MPAMTFSERKRAGKGRFKDVHYRQANLTLGHVTAAHNMSARAVMDQKELEDRLAAAEALSSLGFSAAFMDSNSSSQGAAQDSSTAKKESASTKTSTRGRGGGSKKGDQGKAAGRETKSRSARGRGRGKAAVEPPDAGTALSTTSPPPPPGSDVPSWSRQLATSAKPRGAGRGGGGKGRKKGAAAAAAEQDAVSAASSSASGPKDSGAAGVSASVAAGTVSTSESNTATHSLPARLSKVGVYWNSAREASGNSAGKTQYANTAVSSASVAELVNRGNKMPSSSLSSSAKMTGRQPAAGTLSSTSTTLPATSPDNLAGLPSLRLDSLPGLSLGSTGLTNLPSIPSLPSLPSAVTSLHLGTQSVVGVSNSLQEAGLASQLSPLSRENGEKSLPLKKRKFVDSAASATLSSASQAKSGRTSPVAESSGAGSPAGQSVGAQSTASAGEQEQDPEKPDVVSPGPMAPVNVLCQVLPPEMSMQLLSEITTAISPDEDGDVPLHIAVVHENEAMVKKLIQLMALAGHKVDRYNKQHQTPLHLAVKLASLPSIQMLLEAGADPNLVDSGGLTCTHMAVQGRDIDCLEALLQWGKFPCDLNYRNFEGLAPLHTAVMNNDLEIVTRLLDQGADVNIMDGKSGRTVLFYAAETNQKAAVELLIGRGADPEIANYAGVVPAMAAQGRSHTMVARLLARALEDPSGEEEKGGEKEEQRRMIDKQGAVPFEIVITEDGSGPPQASIQVQGRRLSATVLASSTKPPISLEGGRRVGTPAAPSILQSSSVLGTASRTAVVKNVAIPLVKREGENATVTKAALPGSIMRATHQLPGVITKVMSGVPSPAANTPRATALGRRNSVPSSSGEGGEKEGEKPASSPLTFALQAPVPASAPVLMERSKVRRDSVPESVEGSQPATVRLASLSGVTSVTQEALKNVVAKAAAGKQNGGQPAAINMPMLSSVLSVPLETSPLASPGSSRFGHRVTPLPVPTSSVVTSPAVSGLGATAGSSVSPSAAHSQPAAHVQQSGPAQPTRPLLVLRRSSLDPTSGDRRPMGSIELRHVTTDALLALQRSSTNSVNPANRGLASPSVFSQHVHNILSGMSSPMETERTPPVSNHVSRESLPQQYSGGVDGDPDQPKDLSLKSKRASPLSDSKTKGQADQGAVSNRDLPFTMGNIPDLTLSQPMSSYSQRKRKSGEAQHGSPKPKRRSRAKAAGTASSPGGKTDQGGGQTMEATGSSPSGEGQRTSAGLASRSEGRTISVSEGGLGRTISVNESGLVSSGGDASVKSAEITRAVVQEGRHVSSPLLRRTLGAPEKTALSPSPALHAGGSSFLKRELVSVSTSPNIKDKTVPPGLTQVLSTSFDVSDRSDVSDGDRHGASDRSGVSSKTSSKPVISVPQQFVSDTHASRHTTAWKSVSHRANTCTPVSQYVNTSNPVVPLADTSVSISFSHRAQPVSAVVQKSTPFSSVSDTATSVKTPPPSTAVSRPTDGAMVVRMGDTTMADERMETG